MLPFHKILCPTDFSDPALHALGIAVELAQHFDAELLLVNVVTPVPVSPYTSAHVGGFNVDVYEKHLRESASSSLAELVGSKVPRSIKSRGLLETGDAVRGILAVAEREKVDLIVIATHGRSGWDRLIFGSVTEKVIRRAQCPVFVIREPQA